MQILQDFFDFATGAIVGPEYLRNQGTAGLDVLSGAFARPLGHEFPLGRTLGSGAEKDVYALDGQRDYVARVLKPAVCIFAPQRLAKEHRDYADAASIGLPVPNVVARGFYVVHGAVRIADVMERFEAGSKDTDWSEKLRSFASRRTLEDLDRIFRTFEAGYSIGDIHVMIRRNGSLAIVDISGVGATGASLPQQTRRTQRFLNELWHEVEAALDVKGHRTRDAYLK